jgi:hypothetical protein
MMLPFIMALAATLPLLSMQQCFSPDDTKGQNSPNAWQDLFRGEQAFSLAMLREAVAADATGNVFFSPYSVYNALLVAYFGAENHTEMSLKAALRIPETQVRKQVTFKKQNVHVYISLNTDKDCDLLHDRPVLSAGRTPNDEQSLNCLDYNQNLVMSPRGAQRQDGLD